MNLHKGWRSWAALGVAALVALGGAGCSGEGEKDPAAAGMEEQAPLSTSAEEEAPQLTVGDERSPEEGEAGPEPFDYNLHPGIPGEVGDVVRGNREKLFGREAVPLEQVVERYLDYELDPETDRRIASQIELEYSPSPQSLTVEQMEGDVEFLFDYLNYGYAGYGYFGGDEVFLPMRQAVLEEVGALGDGASVQEFNDLLADHLVPFLEDCHFTLGSARPEDYIAHRYYSVNEEVLFRMAGEEYQVTLDGREYVLASVDGGPPEECLKPILTAEGRMAWAVAVSHTQPEPVGVELALRNVETGETVAHTLELTMAGTTPGYSNSDEYTPYTLGEAGGIPVVQNGRLWPAGQEDEENLQSMVDDAAGLRQEPVVIVDLRGNGGGNSMWADNWVEQFAGSSPNSNYIYCVLDTQTVLSSYGVEEAVENPGWLEPRVEQGDLIPNDSLVLVLIDQQVGSSGELFLQALWQMENVVVIGTNTMGMKTFGEVRRVYLPESGLSLGCGHKLFLQRNLEFIEGRGYQPDLWAPPEECLERAVLFAENYVQ